MLYNRWAAACAASGLMICCATASAASGSGLTVTVLQRTTTSLLKADKPWESFVVNWTSVIRDGGQYKMWYEAYDSNYSSDNDGYLCYATSTDGVVWTKPTMGLVNYGGNTNNNILLSGPAIGGLHGENIFIDPTAPASERYKMVYTQVAGTTWNVRGATSADGINWTLAAQPLLAHMSDTQNVCFRDGNKYRMYVRMWRNAGAGPDPPRPRGPPPPLPRKSRISATDSRVSSVLPVKVVLAHHGANAAPGVRGRIPACVGVARRPRRGQPRARKAVGKPFGSMPHRTDAARTEEPRCRIPLPPRSLSTRPTGTGSTPSPSASPGTATSPTTSPRRP